MKKRKNFFEYLARAVCSAFYLFLSLFIKRRADMVAFGSWGGKLYIDNSRYLFEYVREHYKNVQCVWIGDDNVKGLIPAGENVKVLKKNGFKACITLLKCKYMFCSQFHDVDLCSYNVFRGATITYLHHGMPVKKWGADTVNGHVNFNTNIIVKFLRNLIGANVRYDYFAVSSALHTATNATGLDYRGSNSENNIKSGTPRNDMLVGCDAEKVASYKNYYAAKIGFNPKKRVIMYLPTYRLSGAATRSFTALSDDEYKELRKVLEKYDAVLIEKNHFSEDKWAHSTFVGKDGFIYHVDQGVNVQEMLAFTDVLISDYSGAFLDYLMLDRPIVHYAYDYEEYKKSDSGLYYEIDEFYAGAVAYDFAELLTATENCFTNPSQYAERRRSVKEKFMTYERGKASEIICKRVFEGIKEE